MRQCRGMQDHELYRRIRHRGSLVCGRGRTKTESGEVHVYLRHHDMIQWPCPECGAACKLYDHQPERQWRHLDTCQFQTILHAAPRRSECSEHGVRVIRPPWAEPSSRFTALFEALAIRACCNRCQTPRPDSLGMLRSHRTKDGKTETCESR
jgi:transposase